MIAAWIGSGLLQPTHLLFILVIVLILFGPGKLPDLGRGLGNGIREFKDALRGAAGGDAEQKDSKKLKPSKEEPVKVGASEGG